MVSAPAPKMGGVRLEWTFSTSENGDFFFFVQFGSQSVSELDDSLSD